MPRWVDVLGERTLRRLAERGLFRAHRSADILDELHRNLVEDGIDPERETR